MKDLGLKESELERAFEKELLDKGYPDSRIVHEFGKINYGIVDFAIVDVDYKTPMAFYEVKSKSGLRNYIAHRGLDHLIKSFQRICNYFGMVVPCYLVYKDAAEEHFSVLNLTKFVGGEKLPEDKAHLEALFNESCELLSYKYNPSGEIKKEIKRAEAKQRRIDKMKPLCWILLPLIGITLLVLEALGIYPFTPMRLIVIGVIVLLLLLPFFSEISIKDISFKRDKEKKEKNNEDDNNA